MKEKEKLLDQEIKKVIIRFLFDQSFLQAKDTSTKYENAHKEFEKRMKEDEVTLAAETARLQDLHVIYIHQKCLRVLILIHMTYINNRRKAKQN